MFSAVDSFLKCGRTFGSDESDNVCELLCAAGLLCVVGYIAPFSNESRSDERRKNLHLEKQKCLLKFELARLFAHFFVRLLLQLEASVPMASE